MSEHCLISGDFFTPAQWRGPLALYVDDLASRPGGILLIAVEIDPARQNYPNVSLAFFDAQERKALRAALLRAKKKREAAREQGDCLPPYRESRREKGGR